MGLSGKSFSMCFSHIVNMLRRSEACRVPPGPEVHSVALIALPKPPPNRDLARPIPYDVLPSHMTAGEMGPERKTRGHGPVVWRKSPWSAVGLAALGALLSLKSAQLAITVLVAALLWILRGERFRPIPWLAGLIAILCFLPESGREWYPSFLSIGDSLLIIFAIMWVRCGGLAQLRASPWSHLERTVPVFLAAGALAVGKGFYFGANLDAAFTDFLQRCGYAALVILLAAAFNSRHARLTILRSLLISASIVAAYGILQVVLGFGVIAAMERPLWLAGYYNYTPAFVQKYIWWSYDMVRKPYSPFFGPNSLAGLLLFALPCIWAQLATGRYLMRRRWLWLCFALQYLCLILTFSRTCQVAWAGTLALSVFLIGRHRRTIALVALCLILTTAVLPKAVLQLNQAVHGRAAVSAASALSLFESLKQDNVKSRVQEIRQALRQIAHYPLVGTGFSTRLSPADRAEPARHDITVSNLYLELATKMGLLGLAIFGAAIGGLLLPILVRLYRVPECDPIELALFLSLSAALISGLFDHTFLSTPALACLFWIFAAALAAASRSVIATTK